MGFLLLVLGGLLLYGQFNGKSALDVVFKWWPLVFFLLGAEILLYSYLLKEEQAKVKYDFFSFFMILVIVVSGLSLYSLNQLGLTQRLSMMINAQSYSLQAPVEEYKLENTVKKIVITSPDRARLSVRTGTGNTLLAYGYVTADTRESAQLIVADKKMSAYEKGDTLYLAFNISLNNSSWGYDARVTELTLVIPDDRQVEIKGSHYELGLAVDNLKNNWIIDSPGSLEVRLNANSNLAIEALVRHKSQLKGNVAWNIPGNGEESEESEEEQANGKRVQGNYTLGKGQYKLGIICNGEVTVNKI